MSRHRRLGLLALTAAVIVVGFVIALSSGGGPSGRVGGPQTVTVVHGQAQGAIAKLTYRHGQTVDLTVTSDAPEEIHIHGYDLHRSVAGGASVHFRFAAKTEGRFVVELERTGRQIAELTVQP
ncbi:MAG TPA: hypothetical protein VGN69_05430 [Solirubrobacteraceae bacterium]|nr:hypothetical protein [Solirubrobacteraceae bacterium]